MRMCIVTREKKPKMELMRLVRVGDEVRVDPKGKERGRGANIAMDLEVFDQAVKKNIIARALKLERKLKPREIEELRNDFQEAIEERKFRQGNQPVVVKVDKEKWNKITSKK